MTLSVAQVSARRGRLGSTEIAAVVALYRPELAHLSKKKNATDVWLRLLHDIELPSRDVMDRGVRTEPLLAEVYRESVGPLRTDIGTINHRSWSLAVASPDGLTDDALVELKTACNWVREKWGEPGTDLIPDDYNLQVQWLLEVADRDVAHILVAFGNDLSDEEGQPLFAITETAAYLVRRDPELVAELLSCAARFFAEHIETKTPPPMKPVHNIRKFNALIKESANGKAVDSESGSNERGGGGGFDPCLDAGDQVESIAGDPPFD